jgi:hypothetical protein
MMPSYLRKILILVKRVAALIVKDLGDILDTEK